MPKNIQPIPAAPTQYKWKEPSNKVYVVAGAAHEFHLYRAKKREEGSTDEYYYVVGVDSIRGLSEIKGVFIGTWNKRTDIEAIQHQINVIKNKMANNAAVSTAAGLMAQEIDKEVMSSVTLPKSGNIGIGTSTGTITSSPMSFNSGSSIQSLINAQTSILTESAIRDMMKQYIDEALKDPKTLGGI